MVDYKKWDTLELSDDSDIEVHLIVDKRSFIRAKQSQIHMEREQRKQRIELLKYELVINKALVQRVSTLLSFLESHAGDERTRNPANVAFQALMELSSCGAEDDYPPPRPSVISDADHPMRPTYSKMVARILDEVKEKVDEQDLEKDKRYEALIEGFRGELQKIQDLQGRLAKELVELEMQGAGKITSESYSFGFDSSYVNKVKLDNKVKEIAKSVLLNPNSDLGVASSGTESQATLPGGSDGKVHASTAAKEFAEIKPADYRTSYEFLSSHPEILQESNIDGLLFEALNTALDQNDSPLVWQYVHQACLLQCCRLLGPDGVAVFFKRMTTPGHQAREVFEKEVGEKFQRIRDLAMREAKHRAAEDSTDREHIQLHSLQQDAPIHIKVPQVGSGDDEVRKARAIFETFAPEMRAALERGSLQEVNKVLGTMEVAKAEKLVDLLGEAGCLSVEKKIIDTTTHDGKKRLSKLKDAVAVEAEPGI